MVMGGGGRGGAGARGGQRGGGGGAAAAAPDATGKLKLWVKDGLITQAEVHVESKFTLPNGDTRDFHSISKTEIKGVESTQLSIPEDAKKKLGS
jgi:hypothetical protein